MQRTLCLPLSSGQPSRSRHHEIQFPLTLPYALYPCQLLLSVNFRLPSAGIVLDYLNCNSNGRGVQEVSAGVAVQRLSRNKQRATAIFFLHFLAVFSGFLSILILILTPCDPHPPCVPHLSVAFYVVKGKASPEQFRRGFAVLATKDNPRLCRGEKTAYGEGQSRQEKVSELE